MREYHQIAAAAPDGVNTIDHGLYVTWLSRRWRPLVRFFWSPRVGRKGTDLVALFDVDLEVDKLVCVQALPVFLDSVVKALEHGGVVFDETKGGAA